MNNTVPPGYKQTEVGVIPEEWEVVPVGELAVVEGGYAYSSKKFLQSGKYQVVKMSNLYAGELNLERSTSFLNELDDQEGRYLLQPDDILITLTGTTGKQDYGFTYRINDEQNLLLNQRVARLVVNKSASASYVAFQLKTSSFLRQFFDVSKGGTGNQTNVGTSDVATMYIPLPPLPEQRAIAAALSDVDALIASLDKLIAKKRDMKQAAMQELLTGKRRLPGFDIVGAYGNTPNNGGACTTATPGECHSPLPDVPHGWEVKKLGEIADIRSDGTPSTSVPQFWEGDIPWCTPTDITALAGRKYLIDTSRKITSSGLQSSSAEMLPTHSIVMTSRATIGECAINTVPVSTNQGFKNFIPFDATDIEFLYYLLTTQKSGFIGLCSGSTFLEIGKAQLLSYQVCLPSKKTEQTAIAAILSDMDTEIAALEQKRDKTRLLKQGMMQELLTGRIRLV